MVTGRSLCWYDAVSLQAAKLAFKDSKAEACTDMSKSIMSGRVTQEVLNKVVIYLWHP